jgi:hypothetical protein
MKYTEENWLSEVVSHLETLKRVYEDEAMPSMIDESDRSEDIENLVKYLNKTN